MICVRCGKEIQDGSNICTYCNASQKNTSVKNKRIIIIVSIAVVIVAAIIGLLLFTGVSEMSDRSGLSGTWYNVSENGSMFFTISLNSDGTGEVYEYEDSSPCAFTYKRNADGAYVTSDITASGFWGALVILEDGKDLLISGDGLDGNTRFTKSDNNSDAASANRDNQKTTDKSLFEVEKIKGGVRITGYNGLYGVWKISGSSEYAISFNLDGLCIIFDNYEPFFTSYTCNNDGTYTISNLSTPNISGSLTIRKDGEDLIVSGLGQDERFTNKCLYGIWKDIDNHYKIEMNFDGACIFYEYDVPYSATYVYGDNGSFVTSELSTETIKGSLTIRRDGVDLIISGAGLKPDTKFTKEGHNADIVVPENINSLPIKEIEDYAFINCWLTSIGIPDGVTKIGKCAFEGCSYLTDVFIPESVMIIDNRAFNFCKSLESVSIPESVTQIGSCAFGGCVSLTSINIPSAVKKINPSTFGYCISLKQLTLPDGLTEIGNYAFCECGITELIIPETVTKIGEGAFSQSGLTSITIPSKVKVIEKYTFCQSDLPSTVRQMRHITDELPPIEVTFTGKLDWICIDAFDRNSTVSYNGKAYSVDNLYYKINGEFNSQPLSTSK